jgi:hypothetical protein
MKQSELRSLIREEVKKVLSEAKPTGIELWAAGSDYNVMKRTIGDILDVKKNDIPLWTWLSTRELNSYNWKGFNQASRFAPVLKQLAKHSNETVGDFFGKSTFDKLKKLQRVLNADIGRDPKPEEYKKAFDAIYTIVSNTLKSKA